jgi:hypothetical protein
MVRYSPQIGLLRLAKLLMGDSWQLSDNILAYFEDSETSGKVETRFLISRRDLLKLTSRVGADVP